MRLQRDADAKVAAIAARQHGVITYAQLLWVGLSQSGIQRRLAKGTLHRLYRGVYAVGHPGLSRKGGWLAAVLACGDGAVLSHRSAAELWRMLEPSDGDVHVTVPAAGGRARRDGIRLHRVTSLQGAATTRLDSIPVTTPQRTLEDLRRPLSPGELRRALREAEFRRLPVSRFQLVPDRAGNDLELDLLRLCRRHRLPEPEVNVAVGPFEVDFLWPDARLVVETDGYDAHRGRVAFELDHQRDAWLAANGYTVLRFTSHQVRDDAATVVRLIRLGLGLVEL